VSAKVPPGFRDDRVTSFDGAMSLAFMPDGAMLIAGRTGQLRVHRDGRLSGPALSLRDRICWDGERGMLGVAVDPAFARNRHIYLYYTYDKHSTSDGAGGCAERSPRVPVDRVSRFTLAPGDKVDPASEVVLVDNIPSYGDLHNGGDLGFGRDGKLYVSVGDGECDYARDSGCQGKNDAARDRHVLLGKILRLTRRGGIPADNPFQGLGTARCAGAGGTTPGKTCQETYAMGLRNPFRFAFDPDAAGTRFLVNDVGEGFWEEINRGASGADYGWNVREGYCRRESATRCGPPGPTTNPIFAYLHADGCSAITGGAFVPAGTWGRRYEGRYLFGDYTCGKIRVLERSGSGYDTSNFATGLGPVIDMVFGPDGAEQALYYTAWKDGVWEVRRISAVREGKGRFGGCGEGVGLSVLLLGAGALPCLRRRLRAA
jgi:glucose/arabinose dehydrogenase